MMKKVFTGELTPTTRIDVADRSSKASRRRSRCIGAAIIWLFFGAPARIPLGDPGRRLARSHPYRLSIAGISIPVFLLAPVLIYLFAYQLEILPNGQYVALRRPGRMARST